MTETKHTPGPWTIEDPFGPDDLTVVANGNLQVYDWKHIANISLRPDDIHLDPTPAEATANAQLIAAAPELLAACKLWDEGFVDGEDFDETQFLKWVNANRAAARAAIAKAEGRPA